MDNENNEILSERLRELRKMKKMTQRELSRVAGVSKSYYNDIEARGRNPSEQILKLLAKALGVTTGYLRGESDDKTELKDLQQAVTPVSVVLIPLVGEVRAGVSMYAQNNIESYIRVDGSEVNPNKTYFYLTVVGDSMDKVIRDGDKVLVEHTSSVETGDIVIALFKTDEATIKKVRFSGDRIVLIPDSYNPKHVINTYREDEVMIIGKVIKAERHF